MNGKGVWWLVTTIILHFYEFGSREASRCPRLTSVRVAARIITSRMDSIGPILRVAPTLPEVPSTVAADPALSPRLPATRPDPGTRIAPSRSLVETPPCRSRGVVSGQCVPSHAWFLQSGRRQSDTWRKRPWTLADPRSVSDKEDRSGFLTHPADRNPPSSSCREKWCCLKKGKNLIDLACHSLRRSIRIPSLSTRVSI